MSRYGGGALRDETQNGCEGEYWRVDRETKTAKQIIVTLKRHTFSNVAMFYRLQQSIASLQTNGG